MAKKKPVDPAIARQTERLGERLEKLLKESGLSRTDPADKAARSALRDKLIGNKGESLIPKGYNLEGINAFFRGQKTKLKLEPSKAGSQELSKRFVDEIKPGDERRAKQVDKDEKSIKRQKLRVDTTKNFRESVLKLNINEANLSKKQKNALIDKYIDELNTKNRALANERTRLNRTLPEGSKESIGHIVPVSKTIDSSSNRVLEPLTINIQKGDNYEPSRAGQLAIGNVANPNVGKIENWTNDFIVWADKPENGGSGAFGQRGTYSELMEQKLSELTGIHHDKLDDAAKVKTIEEIDDFTRTLENRNQFTKGQQADQKKWGILSQDQSDQMGKIAEDTAFKPKPRFEVTELGRRLGGVGSKLNTTDSVAQIIGGNPIGGGVGLLMQQPAFHKQIAKALGKTLAKSGAKLLPGVGMTMGTLEAAGYASQGRLTQSGIASFSALVGEVPGIGDFLSAGADLVNTGIDLATGNMGKVQMEMDDVIEFDGLPVRALKAARNAA